MIIQLFTLVAQAIFQIGFTLILIITFTCINFVKKNNIILENLKIETIDTYEDIEKQELLKREAFYIRKYTPALNKNIPSRTLKEYRKDSEKYKEYHRQYYKTYMREYRAKNKL
jgi:spore germination protein YaaH